MSIECEVYVGTYSKYNNGSLAGKWIDLTHFYSKEEFYEAIAALHEDEEDPEYMFQDYSYDGKAKGLIEAFCSESHIDERLFEYLEYLEELDEERAEAFGIWMNSMGDTDKNLEELKEAFEEQYQGYYRSYNPEEDFATDLVDETMDLSDWVKSYFDYEKFARDLFITDYWQEDGHIFRNE